MEDSASFGYWVRRRRKALDLTQDALAQRVGCSVMTIRKIEGDIRRPSRQIAALLADCLALPVHEHEPFIKAARAELRVDHLPRPTANLIGQEQIFQLNGPDLRVDVPWPSTLGQHHNNLPLQPTALIGREHEVVQVCQLLARDDVHLLTLTGTGGTGKTRLALQVATELLDTFANGVCFVALDSIRDPGLVLTSIAATLGIKESGEQPLLVILQQRLRAMQLLLLLDNFEQVVDAAPLVATLLEATPQLKVLVTSRASLQIYGEYEFPVPPLGLPNPNRPLLLDCLIQYEAIRLFIERARAVKPDFIVTDANAPAIGEICARLDGLPLAIELAAVRVKVLTPQALLARLTHRLTLLTGGARNRPARQQTLRDTIAWSYELLPNAEQILFARLAIFAGGSTLEAVEAICAIGADAGFDTLDSIQALVNNSLVRQEQSNNGEQRLHMLETLREYALEQLAVQGEEAELRARHATYYVELAEAGQPKFHTDEEGAWLNRLEIEHDNMRAALAWALAQAQGYLAVRLGAALWHFWEICGHVTEGRRWLVAALDGGPDVVAAPRAEAFTGAGTLAYHQGDYAQATVWHGHALQLYRLLNDQPGIAFALNNLGAQAERQADFATAMRHLGESLALAQQIGHAQFIVYALNNMGIIARHQGDYDQAADLISQSLAMGRAMGNQWFVCNELIELATVKWYQGNDAQAIRLYSEALTLCQKIHQPERIAECLEGLAGTAAGQGHGLRAARLFGAAEYLREVIDIPHAPVEHQRYLELVKLAQATLNPVAYKQAWLAGRRMPVEEAIAYGLDGDQVQEA